jgi:hypothetical protein
MSALAAIMTLALRGDLELSTSQMFIAWVLQVFSIVASSTFQEAIQTSSCMALHLCAHHPRRVVLCDQCRVCRCTLELDAH